MNTSTITLVYLFIVAIHVVSGINVGEICKNRSGCMCTKSASATDFAALCEMGEQCYAKNTNDQPSCIRLKFEEYKLVAATDQCKASGCGPNDYCKILDRDWHCSPNSLTTQAKVAINQKCNNPAGCICQPNNADKFSWKIILNTEQCLPSQNSPKSPTKCLSNSCLCPLAGRECKKDEFCHQTGNFAGCYLSERPPSVVISEGKCTNQLGCLCGVSSAPATTVACGFGHICVQSGPEKARKYSCNPDFYMNEIPCLADSGCYFQKNLLCKKDEIYRTKGSLCYPNLLTKVKNGQTCQASEGCVCILTRLNVGDGSQIAEILIQNEQICQFQAGSNSYIQAPLPSEWLCTSPECPCGSRVCQDGEMCREQTNLWFCVSKLDLTLEAEHRLQV